jgi:hypothetical protein
MQSNQCKVNTYHIRAKARESDLSLFTHGEPHAHICWSFVANQTLLEYKPCLGKRTIYMLYATYMNIDVVPYIYIDKFPTQSTFDAASKPRQRDLNPLALPHHTTWTVTLSKQKETIQASLIILVCIMTCLA